MQIRHVRQDASKKRHERSRDAETRKKRWKKRKSNVGLRRETGGFSKREGADEGEQAQKEALRLKRGSFRTRLGGSSFLTSALRFIVRFGVFVCWRQSPTPWHWRKKINDKDPRGTKKRVISTTTEFIPCEIICDQTRVDNHDYPHCSAQFTVHYCFHDCTESAIHKMRSCRISKPQK
ncbi:uncharacterized protein BJX67DRAFT_6343 [Aspergillus lucknowensis]|uniref:Uncharacterized protein n=1 Tax=Aspergillus lucknowensis TaxID=176173 RepID=A0ABR4M751_9EURO